MSIVMAFPCERCSEEPVDGTHEVNYYPPFQFFHEKRFLCGISGIENKIIDIYADVNECRRGR